MEKFSRSKSSRVQVDKYNHINGSEGPTSMQDLRRYSTTSYGGSSSSVYNNNFPPPPLALPDYNPAKIKKQKNAFSSSSKSWSFNIDPELQRKKRVASYKAYSMEGKMKGSFKKSVSWIKETCNHVVNGWW